MTTKAEQEMGEDRKRKHNCRVSSCFTLLHQFCFER